MRLNIMKIASSPGERLPFEFSCDLKDLELYAKAPFPEPVKVRGELVNEAGVLRLSGEIEGREIGECDHCLKPIDRTFSLTLDETVSEALENPEDYENVEVIVAENGALDLAEIVRMKILLASGIAMLCSEDCKGLCFRCGKDLNEGPCACEKEMDPRLAALLQWREQE